MTSIRIYYEDDFQLGVKFGGVGMSLDADFDIIINCGGQQYRVWRKDGRCYNCVATTISTSPKLDDIPIYDFIAVAIPVKNHGLGIGELTIDVGVWIVGSDGQLAQVWETSRPDIELVETDPNVEEGTDGLFVITVEVNPNNEHNTGVIIVQQRGESQTAVMSQAAVSQALENILNDILVESTEDKAQQDSLDNPTKIVYTVEE